MNRFSRFALMILLLPGCGGADSRHGYSPGEVETLGSAKVYHLTDGVFIADTKNGTTSYYLVESPVADYELTAQGLEIKLEGEYAGIYSTPAAPQGFVAAWITEVEGDRRGATRFQIDDSAIADLVEKLTESTTVQDVYRLKQ